MKKKLILLFVSVLTLAISVLGLVACGGGAASLNNTYYKYSGGSYDKGNYFVLKDGKWEQTQKLMGTKFPGLSGTYSVNGETISFKASEGGDTAEVYSGTIINEGTIKIGSDYYCAEGYTPESKKADGDSKGNNSGTTATYTVTFDSKGGSGVASQSVKKGEKAAKPNNPTKSGYTFAGWFLGSEQWSFIGYVVTENITLTAKWDIINYNITYELNGGANSASNPATYTVEDEITFAAPILNRNGYGGVWDITQIKKGSTGNKTVTASYFAIYKTNGNAIMGLTDYGKTLTEINIPSSIDGVTITRIGASAFVSCYSLTSITIPDTVTSIGVSAFYGCSSLTSITVPNSVTSIGEYAFYDCDSLTKVYYKSTAEEWNNITIYASYASNNKLTAATRYYYSEVAPTEAGNYWHYVEGVPTVW